MSVEQLPIWSAADSSQNIVGTKKMNSSMGGSDNTNIPEESAHGASGYVTRFFYVRPKEVTNLMARKAKMLLQLSLKE